MSITRYIGIALCGILLAGNSVAYAAEAVTTSADTSVPGKADTVKEKVEKVKTALEIKKDKLKETVSKQYRRILDVFEKQLLTQQDLGMRIESRITRLKAQSIDTSVAETKLMDAKKAWDETSSKVASFASTTDSTVTTKDAKTAKKEIAKSVEEVRTGIKKVHALFVEVITLLKGPQTSTATTTPAVTQ